MLLIVLFGLAALIVTSMLLLGRVRTMLILTVYGAVLAVATLSTWVVLEALAHFGKPGFGLILLLGCVGIVFSVVTFLYDRKHGPVRLDLFGPGA